MDSTILIAALAGVLSGIAALIVALTTRRKTSADVQSQASDKAIQYWRDIVGDLERRVKSLELRDKERELQFTRATNAFNFLCVEVERDHPTAVKIAREIWAGQTTRDADVTEDHA